MQRLYRLKSQVDGKELFFRTNASTLVGVYRFAAKRYKSVLDLGSMYSLCAYDFSTARGFNGHVVYCSWNGEYFDHLY